MRVKSACLTGIKSMEVGEREIKPTDDEVLVKTHAAGIWGTDRNLYNGVIPPTGGTQ